MVPGNGNGRCYVSVLLLLLGSAGPVSGSFDQYQKFGRHARQMQNWKGVAHTSLDNLAGQANTALSNVLSLNDTAYQVIEDLDKHIAALNLTVNQAIEAINNAPPSDGTVEFPTPISAFQAYISTGGVTVTDSSSTTYKYTNEVLDLNGDHSTSTGLFTAPKLGLYWFHMTYACGGGHHEVYIKVTRVADSSTENIAYAKYYVSQETAAMGTAVLYPGDTVGVYPKTNSYSTYTLDGGADNTFCGYLMAEYDDPDFTPPTTTPGPTTQAPATTAGSTAAPSTAAPTTAAPTATPATTTA